MEDAKKKAIMLVMEPEGLSDDSKRPSDDVDQGEMKCPKCGFTGPREKFEQG